MKSELDMTRSGMRRVSINDTDPGSKAVAALGGEDNVIVFCDGVQVQHAVTADELEGFVDAYVTDEKGKPKIAADGICFEQRRMTGKVVVMQRTPFGEPQQPATPDEIFMARFKSHLKVRPVTVPGEPDAHMVHLVIDNNFFEVTKVGGFYFNTEKEARDARSLIGMWLASLVSTLADQRIATMLPTAIDGLRVEFYQQDFIPGFAAFLANPDGTMKAEPQGPAFCVVNIGACLLTVEAGDLEAKDIPYMIAESMAHELIHVLEQHFQMEFSEEKVEALLDKYREKFGKAVDAEMQPPSLDWFPTEAAAGVLRPFADTTGAVCGCILKVTDSRLASDGGPRYRQAWFCTAMGSFVDSQTGWRYAMEDLEGWVRG